MMVAALGTQMLVHPIMGAMAEIHRDIEKRFEGPLQ
jgi:hypothetical protein